VTLNANILFSLVANETDAGDYAKDVRTTKVEYFKELTDGTGANQAQIAWSDSGTFDNDYFPLGVGFTFTDERGSGSFSAIKFFYVKNTGSQDFSILSPADWPNGPLFAPTSPAGLHLKPGGAVAYFAPDAAGWPTAGSTFGFSTGEGVAAYEVILIGEGTIT